DGEEEGEDWADEHIEDGMNMVVEEEVKMMRQKGIEEDREGSSHNAVDYVNKIKSRFANSPVVYKEFLAILTVYQKRHSYACLTGGDTAQTERMVMGSIGQLFKYHRDLIHQFRFFLPTASVVHGRVEERIGRLIKRETEKDKRDSRVVKDGKDAMTREINRVAHAPILARRRIDVREAIKTMKRDGAILFEKIRQVTTDREFGIIMRHCDLYSSGISSRKDFIIGVSPILSKFRRIYNNLIAYLRQSSCIHKEVQQTSAALDIDYSSCKLNGISYRALPDNVARPKCSGMNSLCYEVLNETWVSIPSWASEDSSVVSSKKTQFEEFVYRTEDERFELDIVIETNGYAIGCLQDMKYKLSKKSSSELNRFEIDDNYGVSSPAIFLRAIRRVYGELAGRMLDSLKKEPKTTIDTLLDSLKEKDREWKDAQQVFNKGWREQVEKHTIRSLDHQSTQIKMTDSKYLRAKNLVNQIESLQLEMSSRRPAHTGPQMVLTYDRDRRALVDASDLLIHHVRRSNLSKEEKKRVKNVLRKFVPEMFGLAEGASSDTEENATAIESTEEHEDSEKRKCNVRRGLGDGVEDRDIKRDRLSPNSNTFRLVYAGNVFYIFVRIHHVLCERLAKLRRACEELWEEQKLNEHMKEHSSSWYDLQHGIQKLRGNPSHAPSFDHVMYLVKESLDGNIEPINLEDEMRSMLPTHASMAFSIDKMVMAMTRQLQIFSSPDTDKAHTLNLYTKYRMQKAPYQWGSTRKRREIEDAYLSEAKLVMEGHNCYRIHAFDRDCPIVTIDMMEKDREGEAGGGRKGEDEKNANVPRASLSNKDKKGKKGRWLKKERSKKESVDGLATFSHSTASLPHGRDIVLLPYENPHDKYDTEKEEEESDESITEDGDPFHRNTERTLFYGRLKRNHNNPKTLLKKKERRDRCASWFL
ncbi:hypothetical protein PFISCL1PPCAC_19920, partial [Pristionchus fissidentatus]